MNHRFESIALHCRKEPGQYSTLHEHLASEKINGVERGAAYLLQKVRLLGPCSLRWAEATLQEHGIRGMRILQGLLALSRKYDSAAIEIACDKAWRSRAFRYRIVAVFIDGRKGLCTICGAGAFGLPRLLLFAVKFRMQKKNR